MSLGSFMLVPSTPFSLLVPCCLCLQVGDGTTTVVLLAGEFLKEAKPFVEDGVHPQNLIRSYRTASNMVDFSSSWLLVPLSYPFWLYSLPSRVQVVFSS